MRAKTVRELELRLKQEGKISQDSYLHYCHELESVVIDYPNGNSAIISSVHKEDVENYDVDEVVYAIEKIYNVSIDRIEVLKFLNQHVYVYEDVALDMFGV